VKNMIDIRQKVLYKAFGLNIVSEMDLLELQVLNEKIDRIDIEIKLRDLSPEWNELVAEHETYKVQDNEIIFKIENTAIFYIKNGNEIVVSPMPNSDEDKIRLFLLGTCMGAILIQRKVIPLHGSAIEIDGKAYAIIGDSGAGKSTLASAFIKRGYKLLSDDVIPISLSQNCIPYVMPAYPQQKLWQESLDNFGMDATDYRRIIERETKFAIPVLASFYTEPIPLAGIFELIKIDNENIELRKIEGIDRLQTLFTHTYRNFIVELLGLMEWHFTFSTKIIEHIEMHRIRRPTSIFTANQLVSIILDTINRGI
jgi:hypothetical protein